MKKFSLVLTVFALASSVGHCARGTPPGSYLRKPVSSVEELAAVIGKDRVVQRQFATHFGVPPSRLQTYIRDNVIITRVGADTPKSVYVIRRNGKMVPQRTTLRRGALIFALKDTGEPLLVLSCGNPVVKKLPPREKVKAEAPQVFQLVQPNEASPPPPPLAVAVVPPSETPPPPPATLGVASQPPPPAAQAPLVAAARKPTMLPLLGVLAVHSDHGGKPPTPPPPPIPEPGGAAAVMATGPLPAAGWAIRRIRNRKAGESV